MRQPKPCDTHRLIIYILGWLGTLSVTCYGLMKIVFNKEPSESLLSGGMASVITGLLGNMGRGNTSPTNSGAIVNEKENKDEQN